MKENQIDTGAYVLYGVLYLCVTVCVCVCECKYLLTIDRSRHLCSIGEIGVLSVDVREFYCH